MPPLADTALPLPSGLPWWAEWNLDPVLLLNLALVARLYQRGVRRVWRSGPGRGVAGWQVGCFAAGLLALLLALASPLDAASHDLSAAHMVQHMLVMNLAAPLVALGVPAVAVLNGVPAGYRRLVGRLWRRLDPPVLRRPAVAWAAYAIALWVWHLPPLYQAAVRHLVVHDLQHLTFFAAAFVYWRAVLDRPGRRGGLGVGLVSLFTTSLHATVLGVFMTLAPRPWYPVYEARTDPWGLSPLEDQQLAGLIMWMPACAAYAAAAAGVLAAWLGTPEEG